MSESAKEVIEAKDDRAELEIDFSLHDYYGPTVQGVGPLSMSSKLELETTNKLMLFVFGEKYIKAVGTPTDVWWTPDSVVDKKSLQSFEQNKETKVFHTKIDLPEYSSRLGCTLAVQETERGQFYSTKVRTLVLDTTMCVFSLRSINTSEVYAAVFQTIISQVCEDPTPRSWRVLLSHHAQLLINGIQPNFTNGCLLICCSFESLLADTSNTAEEVTRISLYFWSLIGQLLEVSLDVDRNLITTEILNGLFNIAAIELNNEVTAAWLSQNEILAQLAKRACKWLMETDRQAPVSSFRYTLLFGVLALAKDNGVKDSLGVGIPPAAHHFRNPLPDFKAPATKNEKVAAARALSNCAAVNWEGIERSDTLATRENEWSRAIKSTENVLQRYWTAKVALRDEMRYTKEMINQICLISQRPQCDIPAWDELSSSHQRAIQYLSNAEADISSLESRNLAGISRELATQGQNLRQRTKYLIKDFGTNVRQKESFTVTTIMGYSLKTTPGSVDGPAKDNKGKPIATCYPTDAVSLPDRGIVFSESRTGKIRLTNRHGITQTLMNDLNRPGALVRVGDNDYVFAENGTSFIKRLAYAPLQVGRGQRNPGAPPVLAWQVTIIGGSGVSGFFNGPVSRFRFQEIKQILEINYKNGPPQYLISDAGQIRLLAGSFVSGKVTSLTKQGSPFRDGFGTARGCTCEVNGMTFDKDTSRLYFTDDGAVRCLDMTNLDKLILSTLHVSPRSYFGYCSKFGGIALTTVSYESKQSRALLVADIAKCVVKVMVLQKNSVVFGYTAEYSSGGTLVPRADGSFLFLGDRSIKLFAPPLTLEIARKTYSELQVEVEELTEKLNDASRNSNLRSSVIVDCIKNARTCIGDARIEAQKTSYREYASDMITMKHSSVLGLVAVAPSVESLQWITTAVLELEMFSLNDLASDVSHSFALDSDIPHSTSSLPPPPFGIRDAVDKSIKGIQWPTSVSVQEQTLSELIEFSRNYKSLLGPESVESVLQGYGFRVRPHKTLLTFVSDLIFIDSNSTKDDEHTPEIISALESWVRSAVPRESSKEELTRSKLLRGYVLIWDSAFSHLENELTAIDEEEKKVITATARKMAKWSLIAILQGAKQQDEYESFLYLISKGITRLFEQDSEVDLTPEMISILKWAFRTAATIVPFNKYIDIIVQSENIDKDGQPLRYQQDHHLSHYGLFLVLEDVFEVSDNSECSISQANLLGATHRDRWSAIIYWISTSMSKSAEYCRGNNWDQLKLFVRTVGIAFKNMNSSIINGNITTSELSKMIPIKNCIIATWKTIRVQSTDVITDASNQLIKCNAITEQVDEVLVSFLHESDAYRIMSDNTTLGTYTIRELEYMIGISDPDVVFEGVPMLSKKLMLGVPILLALQKNPIFYFFIWSELKEDQPDDEDLISKAVMRWKELGKSFLDGTVNFTTLEKICDAMTVSQDNHDLEIGYENEQEALATFCKSVYTLIAADKEINKNDGSGLKEDIINKYPLPAKTVNRKMLDGISKNIIGFKRFQRISNNGEEIHQNLNLLMSLVRSSGKTEVRTAQQKLTSLEAEVKLFDFDTLTIKDMERLEKLFDDLDDRLITMSSKLLQSVKTQTDFLNWLCEHSDDSNFTSAVEMSMGKPEMECPPELWVSEASGTGHPDETKLSQLTSVRTVLHKLLYSGTSLVKDSLHDIIECLGDMPSDKAEATAQSINKLSPLQLAFTEILSADETTSLNRLLNLQQPSWNANWLLSTAVDTSKIDLWLEYVVVRETKRIQARQCVAELLDFQSAIVLAKSTNDASSAAVQAFVAQFGWMRELVIQYERLKKSGHPSRQSFSEQISFSKQPEEILSLVSSARSEISLWEAAIVRVRYRFPALNLLSLKQLLRLYHSNNTTDDDPIREDTITEVRLSVFPSAPILEARELLEGVWGQKGSEVLTTEIFISKMDEMMNIVPEEWSQSPNRLLDFNDGLITNTEKGVSLIVCDGQTELYNTFLSHYIRCGCLPSWHTMLWVSSEVVYEQIFNFLLLWGLRKSADGKPILFCLAGVDAVSEECQRKVASLISELSSTTGNQLTVVSATRNHYIVRQLSHWRTSCALLDVEDLQRLGISLSNERKCCPVTVYTSEHAGAGKSFSIRRESCSDGINRKVVTVPYHRLMTSDELIKLICKRRDVILGSEANLPWALHLDLSDQINESSCIRLFELLTLRSLYDSVTGQRWFLPDVPIYIEAAPGLCDRVPVISYLQSKMISVSAEDFAINNEALKSGMQNSSTYLSSLSWLLQMIECAEEKKGIPLDFEPTVSTDSIPTNAFDTLCRAANLQQPVSLRSLWAFVFIAKDLLEEAFAKTSPLLSRLGASLPDSHSLRGETLDFICRTASDFATRQKRGIPLDTLCVLKLGDDAGYAMQAHFRSEGQPVFKKESTYDPTYVYYRNGTWRLGESLSDSTITAGSGKPLTSDWPLEGGETMSVTLMTLSQLKKEDSDTFIKMMKQEKIVEIEDGPLGDLKSWNEANHEALLVSTASKAINVLALDKIGLMKRMHPTLLNHFIDWGVISVFGKPTAAAHVRAVSSLTGILKTPKEAASLLGSTYCMTQDIVLKIAAVLIRIKSSVPVVLMGECGCGKTHMLRYISAWLGVNLKILDVHGGTTELDILDVFDQATALCVPGGGGEGGGRDVFVFLDEVNTCSHMSLITEAIVSRSLNGHPIHSGIRILAACNPYRKRCEKSLVTGPGLSYKAPTRSDIKNDLDDLVYRVHPIPLKLQEYIFDFGSLTPDVESRYIHEMVANLVTNTNTVKVITELLVVSQNFIRDLEGDPSSVSLRDLKRTLQLARWFKKYGTKPAVGKDVWGAPTILAIAHVFYFRLSRSEDRDQLLSCLSLALRERSDSSMNCTEWSWLRGSMLKLIRSTMKSLCGKLRVEEGVAMNQALQENLYVTMICIFNKIPVFVVGKPGSSKTLTLQVLASNLKGEQSVDDYWKRFPSLYIFPYQCSPLSTAAGIRHQFDIACSYQKSAQKTIVILLLDEVGLAEHSPDMPLKVLHGILVNPPIAVVGLSNWVLDAAKMNRAICLKRCEPEETDINLTGQHIIGDSSLFKSDLLQKLSQAYHKVYFNQPGREFIGMRDYYQTLKLLRREQHRMTKDCLQKGRIFLPNFSESDSSVVVTAKYLTVTRVSESQVWCVEIEKSLSLELFESWISTSNIIPHSLLSIAQLEQYDLNYDSENQNTVSPFVHPTSDKNNENTIKILSKQQDIKQLVMYSLERNFGGHPELIKTVRTAFSTECFSEEELSVAPLTAPELIRSNLCDNSARHLMVLTCCGAAISLLFSDELLDINNTEVLVGNTFKDDAHELHLIQQVNRVKTAMARGGTVVLHNHDAIYESLYDVLNQRYVTRTSHETGKEHKMLRLAVGSRSQLCPVQEGFRIVVVAEQDHAYENLDLPLLNRFEKQVLSFKDCLTEDQLTVMKKLESWVEQVLSETNFELLSQVFVGYHKDTLSSLVFSNKDSGEDDLKKSLTEIASPISIMQSNSLSTASVNYSSVHQGLISCLSYITDTAPLTVVLTRSSSEQLFGVKKPTWGIVTLAEVTTERSFVRMLQQLNDPNHDTVIVQCDPLTSAQSTIDHARHIAETQRAGGNNKHIVFLVHVPPGARDRVREYKLNYLSGWANYFIDDIRKDDEGYTTCLLNNSLSTLISEGSSINLSDFIVKKLSTSMSLNRAAFGGVPFAGRVSVVTDMMNDSDGSFKNMIIKQVTEVIEAHCCRQSESLHFHVLLAIREMSAGTLRHSLVAAVDFIVVQSLSSVLRCLDVNSNLMTYRICPQLWKMLQPKAVDSNLVVGNTVIGTELTISSPRNTGSDSLLHSQFPFSYYVMEAHNTLKNLLVKDGDNKIDFSSLAATTDQLFGKEFNEVWNTLPEQEQHDLCKKFSNDMITTTVAVFVGLSLEMQLRICQSVIFSVNEHTKTTLLAVSVAFWVCENDLFSICSLVSKFSEGDQNVMLEKLEKTPHSQLSRAVSEITLLCVKDTLLSINQPSQLLHWTHAICPSIAIDLKSIGGDSDAEILEICAEFLRDVMIPDASLLRKLKKITPMLLNGLKTVSDVRQLFQDNNIPLSGTYLVSFIRRVSLVESEPIEDDLLRLSCNLKPELWPVETPLSLPCRRGLISALVDRDGLKDVITRAQALQLELKYANVLTALLLSALENLPTQGTFSEDDILQLITSIESQQPELDYTLLNSITHAKSLISQFCDSVIALKIEQDTMRSSNNSDKSIPKKIQIATSTRDLLETQYGRLFCLRKLYDAGGWGALKDFLLQTKPCNWFLSYDRSYFEKISQDEIPPESAALLTKPEEYTTVMELLKTACKGGGPARERLLSVFFPTDSSSDCISEETKLLALMQTRLNGELHRSLSGKETFSTILDKLSLLGKNYKHHDVIHIMQKVGWGPNGTHGTTKFKWDARTNSGPIQTSCFAVMMQVALMLPDTVGSYIYLASSNPVKLKTLFLPTMPLTSEISVIVNAMSEYVTWYKCRNGHLYSIGECGGAMAISYCNHPGCGAIIGGTNHVSAAGNVLIGSKEEVLASYGNGKLKSEPGYTAHSSYASLHRSGHELSSVTALVLKVLFYASLTVGSFCGADLLSLSKSLSAKYIHGSFIKHWTLLVRVTGYSNSTLLILYTEIVRRLEPLLSRQRAEESLVNVKGMETFELEAESVINEVFSLSKTILSKAYQVIGCSGAESGVKIALSDDLIDQMSDCEVFPLWTAKRSISVDGFKKFFNFRTANSIKHPLLASVITNESRLSIIRYLADVLEWHSIIFRCLEKEYFTRAQAQDLPATELISRYVPASEQARARHVLSQYCELFNTAMPMIPNLYECQRNPFLNTKGEVDLGGRDHYDTRQELTPEAPISFSIPSVLPGEVDATGLCSIQLSGLLHRTHNTIVGKLHKTVSDSQNVTTAQPPPTLSRLSSSELSRRVLISYSAKQDLVPLLFQHRIDFDDGTVGYDLSSIEEALASKVLCGKVPVKLQLLHFQFAGEIRQRGSLASLSNIKQCSILPPSMEESIRVELDTTEQLSLLLRLLENVINFVSAMGQNISSESSLVDFIESTTEQENIASILTPTVAKYGKIEHLRSLFLFVEGLLSGGGVLHRVQSRYTKPLTEVEETALRRSIGQLHHSSVVSALRDLLVGALSGNDVNFSETESLKDYVGYQDMDVGNASWFEDHFPEELQLKHTVATYELLISR